MSPLLWLLIWLPALGLLAWVSRRLLGVQYLSALRTLLAAAAGMTAAWLIALAADRRGAAEEDVIVTGLVLSVLLTMATILLLELLARPGRPRRGPRRPRRRPVRAIRANWSAARRATEITRIAVDNGLGPLLGIGGGRRELTDDPTEIGRRLRATLEQAGGMFVKFGQLLATREELVGPEVARELDALHERVAPESREVVAAVLREDLGAPVEEVFASFDWDPLGSASIAQVYRARLHSGEAVVVKVRRSGIVEQVESDLDTMQRLAAQVERRSLWGAELGVSNLAEEFGANLREELDFAIELRHIAEIGAALADVPDVRIPATYPDLSSERVLVMEELVGEPVARLEAIDPERGRRLADVLVRAELESMVEGRTFHADPHPGNVLILRDGGLGLVDFGSTGRLDAFERAAVSDVLMALHLSDPTLMREAVIGIGTVRDDTDPVQLERAFARLLAQHLAPGMVPTEAMLSEFLGIVFRFGIALPGSISAMFRALGTMAGTLERLSPGYPVIDAAQAVASDRLTTVFEPDNLTDLTRKELVRLAPILQRAPRHLDRIASQLGRGELTTRVSLFSTPADVRTVTALVNRFVLAFLGAAVGMVSALLLRSDGGVLLFEDVSLTEVLGYLGLIGGAVLVMRVVLDVLHSEIR
jgi:ubiquinone biosynthesis protein